ncbi:hypothetical protein CK203_047292 [Vitis vinifera]|uniref:Uncharacterized protein n=1 Tax=Vitis vinifera TaxID=29760 RepID=A0A438HHS8_VITVI|nr:hypothetical protein CK203_047292 [Vitis vinifera]
MKKRDFALKVLLRRAFRNCKSGFGTRVPLRSTVTSISQLRNSLRSCCENGKLLRNWRFVAKLKLTPELPPFVFFTKPRRPNLRSSSPFSSAGQRSIAQNGTNARGKVFISFEPQKESAKGASPGSVPEPAPKPSPSRPNPSPVKPTPPKPPARRYLTRSGGQPLKKKPRVESSEPIDLTEQSPEKSQSQHRFNLRYLHQILHRYKFQSVTGSLANPSPEATPIPSPVPSSTPQEKAQEPQAPIPEPQIASGNTSGRTAEEISYGASASSKGFFYPRVVTDFYQTMTTKEVRNPTLIHFIIDGRHGILGARHIAEALQIPFEPTQFDNFKAWTNPTELEMHWTQRRGILLEALYKMSEGFFFGPHHLIMAALLYFEEKVHKKKLQRADCIPLLFPGCYAKFWSISDTPLSLSRKEREYAPGQPQPAARRASPRHPPEGITLATPAIPRAPPATPAPSQPSTSAEPRMAIPISEYRELCRALETLTASQSNLAQELAAIKACQEQMLASQAQQAAILRQLQVHFDLPQAVEPSIPTPPEPHSQPSESQAPEPEAPADPPTEEADPSA